jgi:hypothetical protein
MRSSTLLSLVQKMPDLAMRPTRLRQAALNKRKESIMNDKTNPLAVRPREADD